MKEAVIIHLGSTALDPIEWWHWSFETEQKIAGGTIAGKDQLSELQSVAEGRQLTVLVPTDSVIMRTVSLNGKIDSQTLKALPYLLEESVVAEVEDLHIVVAAREENDFHLLAVERQRLTQWLSWLAEAELTATQILPELLLLPINPQGWSAVLMSGQWLIRQSEWSGMKVEEAWLLPLWQTWHNERELTGVAYSSEGELPEGWQRGEIVDPTALFSAQLNHHLPNLLTGEFRPAGDKKQRRPWYIVAASALFCAGLYMVGMWSEGHRQEVIAQYVKGESMQLFQNLFPDEVVSNKKNLQSSARTLLQELEDNAPRPGFLWLLSGVAPLVNQLPQAEMNSLEFDGEQLTLQVSAKDFSLLQSSENMVPDIAVQLLDEKKSDDLIEARLIVKRKTWSEN